MKEYPNPELAALGEQAAALLRKAQETAGEAENPLARQALDLLERMHQALENQQLEEVALKQQLVAQETEVRAQDEALEENLHKLRELHGYFDAVFRQAPMGYLVLHPDGGIRNHNNMAEEYLGAQAGALQESTLKAWVDADSWMQYRLSSSEVLRLGERRELTLRPAASGRVPEALYTVLSLLQFGTQGESLLLCSLLDVSEQRRTHRELVEAKEQLEREMETRAAAQKRLEVQRARFRRLIEENADALLVVAVDGLVRYANPAAVRLFGHHEGGVLGSRLGFNVVPSEVVLEQPGDQPPRVAELRYADIDWEGEPARLVTLRDVTDRKKAEQELMLAHAALEERVRERTRELEQTNIALHRTMQERMHATARLERTQKAVDSSGDAIIIADRLGHAEYCNPATQRLFGYNVQGLNRAGGLDALYVAPGITGEIREALQRGESFSAEVETRCSEGSILPVLLRMDGLREESGELVAMVAVHKDVSEIRAAQHALETSREEFRNLADNLPDMIARIDRNLCYSFVNRALSEAWGHPGVEAYGVCLRDMDLPDDLQQLWMDTLEEVLEHGVVRDIEFSYTGSKGRTDYYRSRIAPEFDHEGRVTSCVSLSSNITARVEMERELRHSQKLEALGAMAGKMAHDFNNMLGVIMTSCELLQMKLPDPPPEVTRRLQRILEASQQAKAIISRMLGFARMDMPEKRDVDLEAEVRKAMSMLQDGLPATIDLDYTSESSGQGVYADSTLLQQIIINLGLNAKDAIGDDVGRIEVVLDSLLLSATEVSQQFPELEPGWYGRLTISDTGPGIAEEHLERIFEPFFTTKGKGKGSGLGLSMVHRVLKQHNGAIRVESRPGRGARFSLFLPLSVHRAAEIEGDEAPPVQINASVLIVDDEPAFLESLQETLQMYGCSTVVASNGFAALQKLEGMLLSGEKVDLLFTDQTMPGMTGSTLIGRARALAPGLPAVLCTGYSENLGSERFRNLNASFLSKPFSCTQLLHAVARALQL